LHPLFAPYADHEFFAWMRTARSAYDAYYCCDTVGRRQGSFFGRNAVSTHLGSLSLVSDGHAQAPTELPVRVQLSLGVAVGGSVGVRLAPCAAVGPAPPMPAALVAAMEAEVGALGAKELIFDCDGSLEGLSAGFAEDAAAARAEARAGAQCGGYRPPYAARRHTLAALGEDDLLPDTALSGKAKPPDLSRLEWQQQMLVDASGVFVKATRARLGEASAAQFYGWQRSIIGHLTALRLDEQVLLEAALDACPAPAKADARGSPVPFARELASYLAHCDNVGGLALAINLEDSPFAFFFRALNRHLAESVVAMSAGAEEPGSDDEERPPSASGPAPGLSATDGDAHGSTDEDDYGESSYLMLSDSDSDDGDHISAAARFRFGAL
jgi:hypothetical protein